MIIVDVPYNYDTGVPDVPDGIKARVRNGESISIRIIHVGSGFVKNALCHGVAGLWVEGGRVAHDGQGVWDNHGQHPENHVAEPGSNGTTMGRGWHNPGSTRNPQGRWPANLILSHSPGCKRVGVRKVGNGERKQSGTRAMRDNPVYGAPNETRNAPDNYGTETVEAWECVEGCPVAMLDEQSGVTTSSGGTEAHTQPMHMSRAAGDLHPVAKRAHAGGLGDTGGASRFFYCPKASRKERNAGCEGLEETVRHSAYGEFKGTPEHATNNGEPRANNHPTVKPIALMRYLCKLTRTPTGGVVLDPFMGSGSTGCAAVLEGRDFVGIDIGAEYVEIARRRIEHWAQVAEDEQAEMVQEALL